MSHLRPKSKTSSAVKGKVPVMILCGGTGSRLHEESEFRPKPMLEIGGRPILWHIMKIYSAYGFRNFILCLGYKGFMIKSYFLNYHAYSADVTVQLGESAEVYYHNSHEEENWEVTLVETGEAAQTGARVARAGKYIDSDTFCLTYGDGLARIDILKLLEFHRRHGKIGTITGVHPPGRFGELEIDRKSRALHFNEKPQVTDGLINGGFLVLKREFLSRYLKEEDSLVLEHEPLQRLARHGELMVYQHEGFWQPMDTYREWRLLNQLWNSGRAPWKMWP